MARERIDQRLVREGLFESREAAQRAVMAGLVRAAGQVVTKPGTLIAPDVDLAVAGPAHPYVSRGGLKLAHALESWPIEVSGRICLDVGASTGGFTDVLLRHGAARVYAIDVGYGQLAWKLRQDPRVVVLEKTNIRHLAPERLYDGSRPATLATIDVSFIGLAKVLPAVKELLTWQAAPGAAERRPAEIIALVKPQFEAGRDKVGKKGVVRDPAVREEAVRDVREAAEALGMTVKGVERSPIEGPEGNVEFLLWLAA